MYGAPRFCFDIICPKDSFCDTQRLYLVKPAGQIVSRKKFEYWSRQPGFKLGLATYIGVTLGVCVTSQWLSFFFCKTGMLTVPMLYNCHVDEQHVKCSRQS